MIKTTTPDNLYTQTHHTCCICGEEMEMFYPCPKIGGNRLRLRTDFKYPLRPRGIHKKDRAHFKCMLQEIKDDANKNY